MKIKPGDTLTLRDIGYATVKTIKNVNGQPVFVIENLHETTLELSLEEMMAEKPKHWTN